MFELGVKSNSGRGLGLNAAEGTLAWVYFFTQFLDILAYLATATAFRIF